MVATGLLFGLGLHANMALASKAPHALHQRKLCRSFLRLIGAELDWYVAVYMF